MLTGLLICLKLPIKLLRMLQCRFLLGTKVSFDASKYLSCGGKVASTVAFNFLVFYKKRTDI